MECLKHQKEGDIMLYEMHAIGPNRKFIAMDWWPDNFAGTFQLIIKQQNTL